MLCKIQERGYFYMKHEIKYEPFHVVICELERGEELLCQSGAMSWCSPTLEMQTTSNGGICKMFGRMFSGESMFLNRYIARDKGTIALSTSFAGTIIPIKLERGKDLVVQKSGYLASYGDVKQEVFFQKKLGAALFGGEGFVMQRLSGDGIVFIEIDGAAHEQTLGPGEKLVLDTGYLALMEATCKIDIQSVQGVKNALFGGEGLFNTIVTGPGKIWIQTKPISGLASALRPYFPSSGS